MSLEQSIQANTAVIERLIGLITNGVGAAQPAQPPSHPAPPAASKVADKPAPGTEPAALVFPDLEKRFRVLVTKNRDAAVALLASLGVAKLTLAKLPQYPQIDEALKAAGV